MEVRSNNEKCGNDAVALTTTTPTTINPKSLNFCASDDGFNVGRNKSTSQPLTKDESKCVSVRFSYINLHSCIRRKNVVFQYTCSEMCCCVARIVAAVVVVVFFVLPSSLLLSSFCIHKCTYARFFFHFLCARTCD